MKQMRPRWRKRATLTASSPGRRVSEYAGLPVLIIGESAGGHLRCHIAAPEGAGQALARSHRGRNVPARGAAWRNPFSYSHGRNGVVIYSSVVAQAHLSVTCVQ